MLTGAMNLHDLSVSQLKRAAAIKEQIQALNQELDRLLGAPAKAGAATKSRAMSASVKKKIAAAQKVRWAKVQGAKPAARSVGPGKKAKKKVSRATRAKLRAKLKAFWAAKRAGKK